MNDACCAEASSCHTASLQRHSHKLSLRLQAPDCDLLLAGYMHVIPCMPGVVVKALHECLLMHAAQALAYQTDRRRP